ncbi:S10 family peptidase [Parvularcula oceani]|uniref:S10 family peptidase n=1 Tax=Parvularcula oceani TaxID=1247963 RepID=UPI000ABF4451|nr:peptidase S10 [Parvularcula oceani]
MVPSLLASLLLTTAAVQAADTADAPASEEVTITQTAADAVLTYGGGADAFDYRAKAGFTPLGPEGEPEVEIFSTAYLKQDADPASRPVTFVFNGGPGAASIYLHMGALGPVRLAFAEDGTLPPPPITLEENPDSWLPFTDLVFIDPVGTGFSRFVGEAAEEENGEAKGSKTYHSVDGDLTAMGDFIERWLAENGRYRSPVVVAGESYGGFRSAALAQRLPTQHNVPLTAAVLISPKFDLFGGRRDMLHPAPWLTRVPSYAATAAAQGVGPSGEAAKSAEDIEDMIGEAEEFALNGFTDYLVQGERMDEAEREDVLRRFAEMTGLDYDYVSRQRGRISQDEFARALLQDEGRLLGIYDASVTGLDPAPDEAEAGYDVDPTLAVLSGPFRAALVSFLSDELGFNLPDRRYQPLSRDVSMAWRYYVGSDKRPQPPAAAEALREGLALNPHLKVWITHGYFDLQTPYFETAYIINNLAIPEEKREDVTLSNYWGGHMYYMHPESSAAFGQDARAFYDFGRAGGGGDAGTSSARR